MRGVDAAVALCRHLGEFMRELREHRYGLLGRAQQIVQLAPRLLARRLTTFLTIKLQILNTHRRRMYRNQIVRERNRFFTGRVV